MFLGFEFFGSVFLSVLPQDKARSIYIYIDIYFFFLFFSFFFHLVKIYKLILFLKDGVTFLKC